MTDEPITIDEANVSFTPQAIEAAKTVTPRPVASGWFFLCPKRGHQFEPDAAMLAQVGPRLYAVRICIDCGCPVYIPMQQAELSPIVDLNGDSVRVIE